MLKVFLMFVILVIILVEGNVKNFFNVKMYNVL